MISIDLGQKIAMVTGASRGIGRATALRLAEAGAAVALVARSEGALAEVADAVTGAGGRALVLPCDISDVTAPEAAVESALKELGRIDILVNNAGITDDNLMLRMRLEAWQKVLATNLTGTFLFTKAVTRPMMKARSGRIINVASVVGLRGNAGQANYAATKAGIIGFTKSVARELASRGILVNAVAPGFIETAMTAGLSDDLRERALGELPLGAMGRPEDVADAILFLASPLASYITGTVVAVDGGLAM